MSEQSTITTTVRLLSDLRKRLDVALLKVKHTYDVPTATQTLFAFLSERFVADDRLQSDYAEYLRERKRRSTAPGDGEATG